MFDAGFHWARVGQYEDTSDITGWDWIEQKRGEFRAPPGLDDYINSLVDNGMVVELQLLYGNPIYTSPAGRLPESIIPTSATVHAPDRSLYSIFWPPKTSGQIAAFLRYAIWMVNHFRGRIHYYELWNEPDGAYWNPRPNGQEYGRLLKAFVPAVHQADPEAKVVFNQGTVSPQFAKDALDACQCASALDVFAYHTYPGGYARNVRPESVDYGAFGSDSPRKLREFIRHYPGIRPDIQFWDDEYNSLPTLPVGMDESVQAKYVPRMMVYNWAAGIPTFIWELINDTSTSEGDGFGIIHGLMYLPTDFVPRPVFKAIENTNAIFSDTRFDPSIRVSGPGIARLGAHASSRFMAFGFRSREGKAVVAYWLAAHSWPGRHFTPLFATLTFKKTGIERPVLININMGKISPLNWKAGTDDTLEHLPIRDSVQAIADESYFDWRVLPQAPSSLKISLASERATLTWEVHGGDIKEVVVERRVGELSAWRQIARLAARATEYTDPQVPADHPVFYRVRAFNDAGESAYSNIVRTEL